MRLTLRPRASRRQPMEAAARPLPSEDTTPPVTKMYFADIDSSSSDCFVGCAGWRGAQPSMKEKRRTRKREKCTKNEAQVCELLPDACSLTLHSLVPLCTLCRHPFCFSIREFDNS